MCSSKTGYEKRDKQVDRQSDIEIDAMVKNDRNLIKEGIFRDLVRARAYPVRNRDAQSKNRLNAQNFFFSFRN